ncbi:GTPase IMAP family member 7-like [Cebidichthys violaceus]|uniref:GTPase IMAP family member 7-like n=1 Tax=Cebidichthys violaceus TaxID=271503 RepID=UPI0035CA590D
MTNYSTTQQQQDITDQLLLQEKDKAKMSESKEPELKIVLIGITGEGKTSVMNTLMGREPLVQSPSASSDTKKCKTETREFDGQKLVVIDTPGLMDKHKTQQQVENDLAKTITCAAPGPHMFLLVMKPFVLTKAILDAVEIIQEMFGENTKDYTLALFTCEDKKKLSQDHITEAKVNNFSVDWHTFDNTKKIPDQVPDLLKKINKIVGKREEKKKMYTNEMFEKAQELKEETRKKMKEEQEKQGKEQEVNEEGLVDTLMKAFVRAIVGEEGLEAALTFAGWMQDKVKVYWEKKKGIRL